MNFSSFFFITFSIMCINLCYSNVRPIEEDDIFGTHFMRAGKKFIYGGVEHDNPSPNIWSVFRIEKNGLDGEAVTNPKPHSNEHKLKFTENQLFVYSASGTETSKFKWVIEWPDHNQKILIGQTSQHTLFNFLYTEEHPSSEFTQLKPGTSQETYAGTENFKHTIASLLQDFLASPADQFRTFESTQNLCTGIGEIASIGGCCLVKREINHYFNPKANVLETKRGHSHFFDWTGIFDYNQTAAIIRNKLSGIFDREKLTIKPPNTEYAYPIVYNREYEIRWKHLFENKKEFPDFPKMDFKIEDFDAFYPKFKSKTDYLIDKFLSLKNTKTLYVLANIYTALDNETLRNVRDALLHCRDGDSQFSLLVMTDSTNVTSFENVFVRKAMNISQVWNGSNSAQWGRVLDQFSFTTTIWD